MAAPPAMNIIWMPLAEQDLESAYEYVKEDNADAARELISRIFSAVGMLMRHPMAGREGRVRGTRELAVPRTPYIVVYRFRARDIQILSVLHGARKWPSEFDSK